MWMQRVKIEYSFCVRKVDTIRRMAQCLRPLIKNKITCTPLELISFRDQL